MFFSDGEVELLLMAVDGFVILLVGVGRELEDGTFFFSFPTGVLLLPLGFVAIYN